MVATFVLDTSVLLDDPDALDSYKPILIPNQVFEELDDAKTRPGKAGFNARKALKRLERGGSHIKIQDTEARQLAVLRNAGWDEAKPDNRILAALLHFEFVGTQVKLVSNDVGLRIKARLFGFEALKHQAPNPHVRTGIVSESVADLFDAPNTCPMPNGLDVLENEFVAVPGTGLLYRRKGAELHRVEDNFKPYKLAARNLEQVAALNLLNDKELPLVVLRGKSGSGKTALALATGLHLSGPRQPYDRVVVVRPVTVVGREELGFLPGKLQEKLDPHFQVVKQLVAEFNPKADAAEVLQKLLDSKKLSLEPVSFLRGTTFNRTFVILDEAQNVDKTTVKTVMSRIGPGSKLVITGDFNQIDAQYLNSHTCGISHVVERLAGNPLLGSISFTICQRSPLADLADTQL